MDATLVPLFQFLEMRSNTLHGCSCNVPWHQPPLIWKTKLILIRMYLIATKYCYWLSLQLNEKINICCMVRNLHINCYLFWMATYMFGWVSLVLLINIMQQVKRRMINSILKKKAYIYYCLGIKLKRQYLLVQDSLYLFVYSTCSKQQKTAVLILTTR